MKPKSILIFAGILGVIAVIMGAMGAHGLRDDLNPIQMNSFLTGARYNMYHAIVLLAIAGNVQNLDAKWMKISVISILVGIVLFSGSIYLLSTSHLIGISINSILGPITPIGGLFFVFGWFSIAVAAFKK